jgi:hypothetical protein
MALCFPFVNLRTTKRLLEPIESRPIPRPFRVIAPKKRSDSFHTMRRKFNPQVIVIHHITSEAGDPVGINFIIG